MSEFAEVELKEIKELNYFSKDQHTHDRQYIYSVKLFKKGTFEIDPKIKSWNTKTKIWESCEVGGKKTISTEQPIPFPFLKGKNDFNKNDISEKDVLFVLDLSSSMLAKDLPPNRFELLKNNLQKFLNQNNEAQRIGIIGFAGEAYVVQELTFDILDIQKELNELEVGKLEDGTAIGHGLLLAVQRLSQSKAKEKNIVLITDGINTVKNFDPRISIQIMNQKGIQFSIIGLGTDRITIAPVAKSKLNGNYVYGRRQFFLDEERLKKLVADGGQFLFGNSEEEIYQNIEKAVQFSNSNWNQKTKILDPQLMNIYLENIKLKSEALQNKINITK